MWPLFIAPCVGPTLSGQKTPETLWPILLEPALCKSSLVEKQRHSMAGVAQLIEKVWELLYFRLEAGQGKPYLLTEVNGWRENFV